MPSLDTNVTLRILGWMDKQYPSAIRLEKTGLEKYPVFWRIGSSPVGFLPINGLALARIVALRHRFLSQLPSSSGYSAHRWQPLLLGNERR